MATYNVQNLFLCGEGVQKPAVQRRSLRATIRSLDVDVLVLQEVGSEASLLALNDSLATPYPFQALTPGNSSRSIHLGVLSRRPLALVSHLQEPLQGADGAPLYGFASKADAAAGRLTTVRVQRDLLRCEVALDHGVTLTLFCVHLKSRTNPPWQIAPADDVRHAECERLVALVDAWEADHAGPALLLGDFNDLLASEALAPLRARGLVDGYALGAAQTDRKPATYWPKRGMRIDHILLTPRTAASVHVRAATIHAGATARLASDHYPLSLDITI